MEGYVFNNFRTKEIKENVVLITDHGCWCVLDKNDYEAVEKQEVKEGSELFKKLEETGIIVSEKNFKEVVEKQRKKYAHLFKGTSLHIIVPTIRCNHKCVYCHSKARNTDEKGFDMDIETARKTVDFIFQSPSNNLGLEFQGGEPLINFPVIKEVIKRAKVLGNEKHKNVKVALVTNLTLMTDEILDYLIENNVGICTSLDGPKELHDKNRFYLEGGSSYDDVVEWIKKIKEKRKGGLDALMVTTKESLPYWKEIVDEYVKFGFKRIQIKFMSNLGYAKGNWKDISYSAEEYIEFWKKTIDYMIELNKKGIRIYESITTYILKKFLTDEPETFVDLQSPCGAAIGQLAYDYKGDIYTCDEGRQYDLFKLGNVKDANYKDVLTSEQTCSIIAASTNDCLLCDACAYKPYCGVCPVCNYAETGNLVPCLALNNRCKILKGMFDYILEKLVFDKETKKVFENWIEYSKE